MITKALIGLSTVTIVSAVAAHRAPPSKIYDRSGGLHTVAAPTEDFPLLAKSDRLGPPATQASLTIERRTGRTTSVLIRVPASQLASR